MKLVDILKTKLHVNNNRRGNIIDHHEMGNLSQMHVPVVEVDTPMITNAKAKGLGRL